MNPLESRLTMPQGSYMSDVIRGLSIPQLLSEMLSDGTWPGDKQVELRDTKAIFRDVFPLIPLDVPWLASTETLLPRKIGYGIAQKCRIPTTWAKRLKSTSPGHIERDMTVLIGMCDV